MIKLWDVFAVIGIVGTALAVITIISAVSVAIFERSELRKHWK